ncbi:amylo-alpha-1,6-glucosidase [Saccharothrix sp. Mg75]|uniref:amylo-alpha-1,6-glucosidase n=1 Tax=Saccharothrix sp. Mg75 TaxID=3445357 RepID=UPI003EEF0C06
MPPPFPSSAIPSSEVPVGEIPVGEIPVGEIPVGEIPVGEIPVGEIPVGEIPFSCAGSWLDVSPVVAERRTAPDLHLVSHHNGMHAVLAFTPLVDGRRADTEVTATPAVLSWSAGRGGIDLAFEDPDTLRVTGSGLELRLGAAHGVLTPFSGTYLYRDPVSGGHVFTSYETGMRYRVTALAGTVLAVGDQALGAHERGVVIGPGADGRWEVAVETYRTSRTPYRSGQDFRAVVRAREDGFRSFLDAVAPWRDDTTPAAEAAAYVLWSATVRPAGFVGRPAVLMSKHWMDKVWSWDHCFNALALAPGEPALAWHQFLLPFDHQDDSGALPDSVTHSEVLHNFVKPPVHGWAFARLRRALPAPLDHDQLTDAYAGLSAWTRFWLDHRRVPGHVLPHYQHGNDSGWDNATTFDAARLVETGDLAAFLVLQLHQLAGLAVELGRRHEADGWAALAEEIRAALFDRLWDGHRFTSLDAATGERHRSDSLLDLMPIVLGEHLPPGHAQRLTALLERHLTRSGLATELPASARYEPDGYWRGPAWAPTTVLVDDGLRRAGFPDLADDVSRAFREVCEKSGFAENFDARTGDGLRDRAYTWTASAYLLLAADAVRRRRASPDPWR